VRALDAVADALAERLARPPGPARLAARAVAVREGAGLAAVDGGSALVLEGNGLAVAAVRAAALGWRAHALAFERASPLEVRILDDTLAQELDAHLPGLPPPESPSHLAERLRALREWELAMDAAARLREGDVLAVDGPLAQRDWPASLLGQLADRARDRGVDARRRLSGVPLPPGARAQPLRARRGRGRGPCARAARAGAPPRDWRRRVGGGLRRLPRRARSGRVTYVV
jgi:hypothetical protein